MHHELKVGIIGTDTERHCMYLAEELKKQGAAPVILNNMKNIAFPLTMAMRSGPASSEAYYNEHTLDDTHVYFLRALFLPTPAFDAAPVEQEIREQGYAAYAAERERYAAWLAWLKCMPLQDRLLVNPVDTLLLHFAKPYQIGLLRRAGIPVPDTLVSGNADHVRRFAEQRQVIYKPVAGGAHCRLLSADDLRPERLELLQTAPAIFQEYIPGRDIRVFILNGTVIGSFEIESEEVDYRLGTEKVAPIQIGEEIARMCIQACEVQGLLFSGVDLRLQADGSAVMIECNPSPMFEGFDRAARSEGQTAVVTQLAAYLIEEARQWRGAAAPV